MPEDRNHMEIPPLEELRIQPMPAAAAALREAKGTILDRWRQSVKEVLPQSDELTRRQLEDSIPVLLDRVADALGSAVSAPTDRLIAMSPAHGEVRYHQEFSLNQLLIEYHLLRRIAIQETAARLGRPLAIEEDVALNQGIDVALRQAAVSFAEHQTTALKTETAAMTKFLSFLSHDLRGGLNGAVLMIEVLRRQLANEPQFSEALEDLEVVRRSILDTVSTMERFLNAEKLRLNRMPVKIAPVEINALLTDLHRNFVYMLQEHGVEMEMKADPTALIAETDRQLLTMVLQNLTSNAIKYSRRGKVIVVASVQSDGSCRFAVTDAGPGIAQERINELFAAFSRGETYGKQGVGLGLYIARQAADLLGARLWAESKLGAGATFYLDLK